MSGSLYKACSGAEVMWGREEVNFEQQMPFLEFEFGNTNTGGRRDLTVSEISRR